MSRRKLLEQLAFGTGVAATGMASWPLAASVIQPLRGEAGPPAEPWVEVAIEKEVRADRPLKATLRIPVRDGYFTTLVELGAVWLRRGSDGTIAALSGTCPHLGCGLGLDAKGGFACPCHESHFGPDGGYLKGRRRAPWTRCRCASRKAACWCRPCDSPPDKVRRQI